MMPTASRAPTPSPSLPAPRSCLASYATSHGCPLDLEKVTPSIILLLRIPISSHCFLYSEVTSRILLIPTPTMFWSYHFGTVMVRRTAGHSPPSSVPRSLLLTLISLLLLGLYQTLLAKPVPHVEAATSDCFPTPRLLHVAADLRFQQRL